MIKYSVAKMEDSQKIRELEQKVWKEKSITSPYEAATFVRHGKVLAARDGKKIIGAILSIRTAKDEFYVVDWLVDSSYRSMGVGEKLYRFFLKNTDKAILTFVDVKNTGSIKIHEKLGFRKVRKIKNPYGIPKEKKNKSGWNSSAFLMRRKISANRL